MLQTHQFGATYADEEHGAGTRLVRGRALLLFLRDLDEFLDQTDQVLGLQQKYHL